VASFLARTGPRAVRGSHLTEGDFLAARIVEEQEHQIHDQVRTRAYLANALRTAGRIPEAAAAWHDIDTLLRPERWFLPPPDALMGEVHSLRAAFQQDIGELGAAEASVLQAQDLLRRAGDEEGAAIQRVQRMAILYDDGRPEEVLQVRADVFELPIWLRPYWRHTVAAAYVDLGLVEEARRVYQQLDPPETPRAKAAHELLRANLLCLEGATAAALLAYRSAQRQYKVVGSSGEVLIALLGEVMVLCEEGQVDEACSLVARGTPLVSSVPDPAVQAAFQVVFRAAQAGTLTRQALSACVVAARRARKKSLRG
jgi:tetratricopeptide (TPR) repeat protein